MDRTKHIAVDHIHLRVREVDRSAEFYEAVLGLERRVMDAPSSAGCALVPANSGSFPCFAIMLTAGLPSSADLSGMDHFSVAVRNDADVEEAHSKAVARGARTTRPRIYDGRYQSFVFDPDGYKIEVVARRYPLRASREATSIESAGREDECVACAQPVDRL